MELEPLLAQLNWVDWAILLLLVLTVLAGLRRGFVLGALDLLGVAVGLGVAILAYRQAAALLLDLVQLPAAIASLGAFLALFVAAQIVYSTVVSILFHVTRPLWLLLGPLAIMDRLLGVLPGAIKGLVIATVMLLPFAMLPLSTQVAAAIERSSLGSRLVAAAVTAAPEVETLLGRDLTDGLAFLTPPQTDEGMRINFGPLGELQPDPAAEQRMLELVNQERAAAGLGPLEFDDQLRDVARAHSREMFELGYFAHQSPQTGSPFDRLRRAGIAFLVAGENLAYAPNVRVAHEGLMQSPGHRANILRPAFGRVGIGVIRSQFRGSMYTQKFTN